MKYLIAGTGGVGGSIAGFLALAGKDVTCIARGEHLEAIRKNGLRLISGLKGACTIPVQAFTAEEYAGKADVIFVCVKGYSIDSVRELIRKAAHGNTLVIPVLNVYGTGPRLQRLIPEATVLDGCIYIVAFISAPGEIHQAGNTFRIVFGAHKNTVVPRETLEAVQKDLEDSGIKAGISPDIDRDTFAKWSFISAMACTGAYYDTTAGEVQKEGEVRDTFIGLSRESAKLGKKLGIQFEEDPVACNLKIVDRLSPESTASLQKDLAREHESEIQGLLFDMMAMAQENGVETPVYERIAQKFKPKIY